MPEQIIVNADTSKGTINKNIYGHFAEPENVKPIELTGLTLENNCLKGSIPTALSVNAVSVW